MENNARKASPAKTYLVTGAAGFIGFSLSRELLKQGAAVVGFDNLNDYYDVNLKRARLKILEQYTRFSFIQGELSEPDTVNSLFLAYTPDIVVNLAAQAGVRYSITNPQAYINSNAVGFFNLLEAMRHSALTGKRVEHFVYASSSSVYGNQTKTPFSVSDNADRPVSLYAATKKFNELVAYTYSHLFHIPTTGLRFFTVYGPFGRPDMAYFSFAKKILAGEPIQVFNYGDLYRDFTYIDDIVEGMMHLVGSPPQASDPARIYNIGNNKPVQLMQFIKTLETALSDTYGTDLKANIEFLPMQPGDVYQTYADVDDLIRDFGFRPQTSIEDGLHQFAGWYRNYYQGQLPIER